MQVLNTAAKLKVGVFFGGKSIEREVSLNSGRTICDHLDTDKYEVIPLFQDEDGTLYNLPWHFLHRGKIADFQSRLAKEAQKITWDDLRNLVDFVYLAVHGRFAEDGTIQGMLEILNIPYLGSKIFGSALGMNKLIQKEIFSANGIDVAPGIIINKSEVESLTVKEILLKLEKAGTKLPCIVKPVHEGSSLGVSKVLTEDELIPAIKKAAYVDARRIQDVIIEEKIEGMEFVCVSLQRAVKKNGKTEAEWFTFPITEVVPEGQSIYDYEQKYMPGRATKITPARCGEQELQKISQTCIKASILLNFATISRIDGFLTKDGKVILIDPNTLTGMSPATFLFHQAAEYGMSHTQLINYLIETELKLAGMLEFTDENGGDGRNEGNSVENKNGEKKIRVAVLLGGATNEREISLESGRNVCYKLSPQKYDCIPLFVTDSHELYKLDQRLLIKNSTREISSMLDKAQKVSWSSLSAICDFVFIGLHGGLGEGGGVQGALEMLGIPYNGSGVLASALCMDKFKTNNFLRAHGFTVPDSFLISFQVWNQKTQEEKSEYINLNLKDYVYPLILKPHDDGCSVFVKKIKNRDELVDLVDQYFDQSGKSVAMLEEFIVGTELTCGVIGNDKAVRALVPSNTVAKNDILSIEEKFLPGEGENQTPANLPVETLEFVKRVMVESYKAVGCAGYARIDCFYQDEKQSKTGNPRVVILEFNTLPGMTPATCIFHQAAECGMRPMDFIDKIIELGFTNHIEKRSGNRLKNISNKEQGPELILEPVVLEHLSFDSVGRDSVGLGVVESTVVHGEASVGHAQEKHNRKKSKPGKTANFDSVERPDSAQAQDQVSDIDDNLTMKLF